MRILITIAHLADFAGSELFTSSLSKELALRGHSVVVYAPILGKIAWTIDGLKNIRIINDLEKVKDESFDVIHIQHNITAWMVRKYFPSVPAIMVIHGILPKLEQPPKIDLGVYRYVVVSNGVKEHLVEKCNVSETKTEILNNWVDTERFFEKDKINEKPKRLLVLSNHLETGQEHIYRKICKKRNISFTHVGLPENPVQNVQDYINKADVVVTVGRGAMEAMACGRNVIVSDINGIDGMITPDNYKELVKNNFSGHRYHRKLTEKNFVEELNKYSSHYSADLINLIKANHSSKVVLDRLLSLYKEAKTEKIQISPLHKIALLEIEMLVEYLKESNFQVRKLNSELEKRDNSL